MTSVSDKGGIRMTSVSVPVGTVATVTLWSGGIFLAVARDDGWHFAQGDGKWEDSAPFPDTIVALEIIRQNSTLDTQQTHE